MTPQQPITAKPTFSTGAVHCPICTHSVGAEIVNQGRRMFVKPGQKCARCSSTLDAAYILRFDRAA
jgi:transposase-like protein